MRKLISEQSGLAIVEATILLPFCFIMVIAVYYASIFLCQRANLQANLQTALIYYKNVESDNYVEVKVSDEGKNKGKDEMDFSTGGGVGSSYSVTELLPPYRFFRMSFDSNKFKEFFDSICGYMFFDNGKNVTLTSEKKNYVIYKTISATATQEVMPAISLSMVGASDSLTITATATVVINDSDDLIRNVDFAVDVLQDTKIGKAASNMVDKANDIYDKFTKKFNTRESD